MDVFVATSDKQTNKRANTARVPRRAATAHAASISDVTPPKRAVSPNWARALSSIRQCLPRVGAWGRSGLGRPYINHSRLSPSRVFPSSSPPACIKSGLNVAVQILQGIEGINFIYFSEADVVRHPLVARIVKAYEKHEG